MRLIICFGSESHLLSTPPEVHDIIKLPSLKDPFVSEKFIKLWQDGLSLTEISRQTGRSRDMIRRALKSHRIETNPKHCEFDPTIWRKGRRSSAQPPYGFCYFQGKLVEHPKEQEILLLIARLSKEGMNPNAIANHLNSNNYRPRVANKWNRNTVALILSRKKSGQSE